MASSSDIAEPDRHPTSQAARSSRAAARYGSASVTSKGCGRGRCGCLTRYGRARTNPYLSLGVQGGPVDEFLDAAVECAVLDQLEVEVGRALEDPIQSGRTGDHGEERDLDTVDQAGGHQGPVHRQAAVR